VAIEMTARQESLDPRLRSSGAYSSYAQKRLAVGLDALGVNLRKAGFDHDPSTIPKSFEVRPEPNTMGPRQEGGAENEAAQVEVPDIT
jgi:hypothetical protein